MGAEQSLDLQLAGFERKQTLRQFTVCWGLDSERLEFSHTDAEGGEGGNQNAGTIFFCNYKLDLEREIREPNCAASPVRAHLLSMHLFYRRHFLGEPGETKHQSETAKRARLTALRQGALNISNTHHRQLWVLKRRAFEVEQQTSVCAMRAAAAEVFVFSVASNDKVEGENPQISGMPCDDTDAR